MTATLAPPYAPSWINRLINWIVLLPGPSWLYYIFGLVIQAAGLHAIAWSISIPQSTADTMRITFYGVYTLYFVALTHYLDGQAADALARFRPALDVSQADYQQLEYELTTIPARAAWWITALAIPVGYLVGATDRSDPFIRSGTLLGFATTVIPTIFACACIFLFLYHTIRQLRMVSRIHRLASHVNPFYAGPLYAFSELTSRTGIGLVFFIYFIVLLSGPDPYFLLTYLIIAVLTLVAVAAFVLPLLGMHQRLVQEKARVQAEINHGIEIAQGELQQRVTARKFSDMEDLDKALSNLLSLREVAAKLSTWPWQVETLRGFVSALLLPILIWVFTTALERFLTF